jgi:hypothetical protein
MSILTHAFKRLFIISKKTHSIIVEYIKHKGGKLGWIACKIYYTLMLYLLIKVITIGEELFIDVLEFFKL